MLKTSLKFLADENVPSKSIDHLRENGINVISIRSLGSGLDDDTVLKLAYKERRILITFDKEFGYLIFKKKIKSFGVLLLRFVPASPEQVYDRIIELINRREKFQWNFIVVEEEKIRIRSIQ